MNFMTFSNGSIAVENLTSDWLISNIPSLNIEGIGLLIIFFIPSFPGVENTAQLFHDFA